MRDQHHHTCHQKPLSSLLPTMTDIYEVIKDGILNGEIRAVVRPDGQIGYALTDAGRMALKEEDER